MSFGLHGPDDVLTASKDDDASGRTEARASATPFHWTKEGAIDNLHVCPRTSRT